jgi:hypothetical protein
MKNKLWFFITFTFLILISCGCKKDTSTSIPEQKPQPVGSISSGAVIVLFADSVAQATAKQFIRNLSLIIIDSSRYDLQSPHELDLKVPVGQEFKWADSLKTFSIVVAAYPVFAITQ